MFNEMMSLATAGWGEMTSLESFFYILFFLFAYCFLPLATLHCTDHSPTFFTTFGIVQNYIVVGLAMLLAMRMRKNNRRVSLIFLTVTVAYAIFTFAILYDIDHRLVFHAICGIIQLFLTVGLPVLLAMQMRKNNCKAWLIFLTVTVAYVILTFSTNTLFIVLDKRLMN